MNGKFEYHQCELDSNGYDDVYGDYRIVLNHHVGYRFEVS